MFSFSFARTSERVAVVVNVGSASAGVALGLLRANTFTILASHTTEAVLEDRTREHSIAAVLAALKEAAEKARTAYAATPQFKTHGPPVIGYAILESPWSNTCAVKAVRSFETETKITAELIAELASEALASECVSPSAVESENTFEATTVLVELNGYPTGRPVGKHATCITAHALVSSAEPEIVRTANETLASLGVEKPVLRSGARALFSTARRMADVGEEYVLAHMTDGALYFLTVHGGVPFVSMTIPMGLHEILRRVSGGRLPEEILGLFSLIGKDACNQEACAVFQETLKKLEPDLVRVAGEAMAEMAGGKKLPQRLVLHADARVYTWLSNIFSRIDFEQFTVTAQPYSVRPLTISDTLVYEESGVNTEPSLKISAALVPIENV